MMSLCGQTEYQKTRNYKIWDLVSQQKLANICSNLRNME